MNSTIEQQAELLVQARRSAATVDFLDNRLRLRVAQVCKVDEAAYSAQRVNAAIRDRAELRPSALLPYGVLVGAISAAGTLAWTACTYVLHAAGAAKAAVGVTAIMASMVVLGAIANGLSSVPSLWRARPKQLEVFRVELAERRNNANGFFASNRPLHALARDVDERADREGRTAQAGASFGPVERAPYGRSQDVHGSVLYQVDQPSRLAYPAGAMEAEARQYREAVVDLFVQTGHLLRAQPETSADDLDFFGADAEEAQEYARDNLPQALHDARTLATWREFSERCGDGLLRAADAYAASSKERPTEVKHITDHTAIEALTLY